MLALGFKPMNALSPQQMRNLSRDEVESDLEFCGFLVVSCPIKGNTSKVLKELHQSSHATVMITGDNPLTACHVAAELDITNNPILQLQVDSSNESK